MRREHRRPRIVGSVRLGGSSFVDGGLEYVVWRFAFVSFWFLSVLGGSWQFLRTLLLMAKHETNFAPLGRFWMHLWFANLSPDMYGKLAEIISKSINFHQTSIPK